MSKRKNIYNSGQAMMVATIFFLVISLVIIFGLVGPITRQQKMVSQLTLSRQSYYLAEAGVEDVVYRLMNGQTVGTTETLSLGGSTATTVTTDTASGKEVSSTGSVNQFVRKVKADLTIGDGVAFHYGIQVGTGGFTLGNNAGVNGNVYANGSITGNNGSFISGDAFAVGSVSGVSVSGTTQTGLPAQNFPITEEQISSWKAEALVGGSVGSQSLSGTSNTLGPKKISGDLSLSGNSRLKMTGSLWITGNLSLGNGAEVYLDSGYGSAGGVIIVDGSVSLSNGSSFTGSGAESSYIMVLSTSTSGSAISLGNNAGAVILYAPYGTVQLSNNAAVEQVSAKTISLSNNTIINYNTGIIDISFSSGPGGGYEIDSWKEVE